MTKILQKKLLRVKRIDEPIKALSKALKVYQKTTSKDPKYISELLKSEGIKSDIEVSSRNSKYIPKLLKWVLSTQGSDERDNINRYIEIANNDLINTEDSELNDKQKKVKKGLVTESEGLVKFLDTESNSRGGIQLFCSNSIKELNRINEVNGKAVFKIGNLGSAGNLHILVKYIWIPVNVELVANLLFDQVVSWHGGGKQKAIGKTFRSDLIYGISNDLLEISKLDFKKILNQNTAIFNNRTYDLTSKKDIGITKYTTYKNSFVPFDLKEMEQSILKTKSEIKEALKELNSKNNNIGKVLVDRFPLSYLPDLKNFCEHFTFGLVNIKTDNNRLVIIDGKGRCGKSTIFKMLGRVLPHAIGTTDIVLRYHKELRLSSQCYLTAMQFPIVYADEASGALIYSPNFKSWIRDLFRPFELKFQNATIISNRQIVFALTNIPIRFTEMGDHITDRVLVLKAQSRKGASPKNDKANFYLTEYSDSEVMELLKFILRIGLAPVFNGTLQYTHNPKSVLRFEDMYYDSTREFLKETGAKVQKRGPAKYTKEEVYQAYKRWFVNSNKSGKPKLKGKFFDAIKGIYRKNVVGDWDFERRRIDQDPGDKTTDFVYLTFKNESYFKDEEELNSDSGEQKSIGF